MQCPNCGAAHTGNFCNQCGQSNVDLHVPVGDLVREAAEEALGFDSRLRHTLKPFFFHPGELTRDYLSGRRVRYTSPLKLYLIASVLFFFAASHRPPGGMVRIEVDHKTTEDSSLSGGLAQGLQQGKPAPKQPEATPKPEGRIAGYFDAKLKTFDTKDPVEASREMGEGMLSTFPKAMFVLVPLFAWLLARLWPRRFYAEHLVFALHLHAFAMVMFIPRGLVSGTFGNILADAAFFICAIYLFLALRRVYGEGALRTFFKMIALGVAYSILLLLGVVAATMTSIMLL